MFNVVQSHSNSRLLALESSNIFERTRYLTEVYRNALAREVRHLGYAIERREHGFELAGISPNLLERFSKRAAERDRAITAREAELSRELSRDEIAVLVRETRAKKQHELTPDDVRQRQFAQVSEVELRELHALRTNARPITPAHPPLADAITRASEHVFERKTVVPLHELTAEIGRGGYSLVFRGDHRWLPRTAAIKVLTTRDGRLAADTGLLRREGRILSRLKDPHFVRVLDYSEAGPFSWLAIELVSGVSLASLRSYIVVQAFSLQFAA